MSGEPDTTDTTTITVPKALRDRLAERRRVPQEPLYSVIERELDELDELRSPGDGSHDQHKPKPAVLA